MSGKGDSPQPPDAQGLGGDQLGSNVSNAIANALFGNVNRSGPTGSVDFNQSGTFQYTDPTSGRTFDIPTFTQETNLTPEQQAIFDNIQGAATDISGQLGGMGDTADQIEGNLFAMGRRRLDPLFAERQASLDQKLASQGIRSGSEAYNNSMRGLQEQESDAYNNLLLTGRDQALQEANNPLAQLSALLNQQRGTTPNAPGVNMPNIAGVDFAGLETQQYNQQLDRQRTAQQRQDDILSGLFGLGGDVLSGAGQSGGFGGYFS